MNKQDQKTIQEIVDDLRKLSERKSQPRFIEGTIAEDGWQRLEVMPDLLGWIMEHGSELWRRDLMTRRTSHSTVCICVSPEMFTMIKLKWL